jgi:S1-C subfamily serine protease
VIDHIVAATARITVEKAGAPSSLGSGVVIASGRDAAGTEVSYLLTAAHVVESAEPAEIVVRFTGDAGGRNFPARVLRHGIADGLDLALLKVMGVAAPAVDVQAEPEPHLGEEVLIVGFPWGKRLGLYSGVVSQVPLDPGWEADPGDEKAPSLMVDAAVAKGVSGGGVFRLHTGGLVGIVEASQTTTVSVRGKSESYTVKVPVPGDAFVVPLPSIRAFLQDAGPELWAVRSQR